MVTRTLDGRAIDAFKRSWPCHGLGALTSLECEFDRAGNLVDIVAHDNKGRAMDTHEIDGPALLALTHECQQNGEKHANPA